MQSNLNQKISISLPPETIKYAEDYQRAHGLSSRSEVMLEALKALREKELIESYRQATEDHKRNPDPIAELAITDGLEPSNGSEWL